MAQTPKMVSVGDHSLEMVQAGAGDYTVIFESGFGTDFKVWGKVASEVMKSNAVVLYSRAGTGNSEANPKQQSLENAVLDLSALIENAKLKPPFIFVGHSYGAFLIRAYAAQNKDKVKGLVFVDPAHEKLNQKLKAADPVKAAKDLALQDSWMPEKFKNENALIQKIFDKGQLPEFGELPQVPAVVLTSVQKRNKPEMFLHEPEGVQIWRNLHSEFFGQFTTGAHYVTAVSGHNIHREEPALVVNAINQVIELARQEKGRADYQAKLDTLDKALQHAASVGEAEAEKTVFPALKEFDEKTINNIGYRLLGLAERSKVALLLFKYNTLTYNTSANAFDSYGEALMTLGKHKQARPQFLKAISLAEQNKDNSTLNSSRNNLKKLEALK